jgi:Ca-activated chloride channel family protein
MKHALFIFLLSGLALIWGTTANGQASRAIIVFDASGSMYGEVPGGVKIDIAKKVVTDIVGSIDPGLELGLIAYGHRTKGDCEDIELLVPPQKGSAAAISQAVKALNPKGKTPLTAAVIQAAQFLKFEEARASVILVSDGVETCSKDPCQAAEELERLGIDFTCHVIGFDLKQGESSGLECLAQKTGGMYLAAKDAGSLKASLETAMKQVVKPATTLVVEPKKSSGGNIITGVNFEVFSEGGGEKALLTGSGGRWSSELPKAGKYTISAKRDGKTVEVNAEVMEGETITKEVVFAETGLKAVAYDREGGTAFEKDVSWELHSPTNATGNRTQVAFSYEAKPFLKVEPGVYRLTAIRGNATASLNVTIKEGTPQEVRVILGSGNLKLSAISAEGQPPIAKDLAWDLFSPADAEGQRKKLAYSYVPTPTLTLPSGPCLVTVVFGNAKGQIEVEVKAGETRDVVVMLGSGKLKLSVLMEEGGPPVAKDVAWDVFGEADAEGNRPKAGYSYEAQPTLSMPAGKFRVEVAVGNAKGAAEVEVKAGATTEKVIVLGAGRIKLSALAVEGSPPITRDLAWDLFAAPDAEGNRAKVAFSYNDQPTFSLPSGKYIAELRWDKAVTRKEVEVLAGKMTETALVLNAGTLDLSAVMAPGADPAPDGVQWDFLSAPDAEGERKKVGFSYDAKPKVRLTKGKYQIIAVRGGVSVESEVEVAAGKLTSLAVNLNAGTLRLTSSSNGRWELFDPTETEGKQKPLFVSYDNQVKVAAPAGKVVIVRSSGDKKSEQEVEVKANTLLEIALDPK